jgi:hypothetical protein
VTQCHGLGMDAAQGSQPPDLTEEPAPGWLSGPDRRGAAALGGPHQPKDTLAEPGRLSICCGLVPPLDFVHLMPRSLVTRQCERVTDAGVRAGLSGLVGLEALDLGHCLRLSSEALAALSGMTRLACLDCSKWDLGDFGASFGRSDRDRVGVLRPP